MMKQISRFIVLGAALAALSSLSAQPLPITAGATAKRTTLSANLVQPSNTNPGIYVQVGSTSGCPSSGSFNPVSNPCDLLVGRELMHILAINGTVLTVERGANGTLAEAYPSGTGAFIGSVQAFANFPFPQFGDWNPNNTYTWFTTLAPFDGRTPTQVTDVAGKIWYSAIQIPASVVLTGACQLNGNGTLADKMIFALWDRNGNLLANTATAGVTQSGTSVLQCQAFTAPVVVQGPNLYYIGVQGNGTTAASIAAIPTGGAPTNYPTGVQTGGTFGTIGAITSPATTFTNGVGPIMAVY